MNATNIIFYIFKPFIIPLEKNVPNKTNGVAIKASNSNRGKPKLKFRLCNAHKKWNKAPNILSHVVQKKMAQLLDPFAREAETYQYLALQIIDVIHI